MAFLDGNRMTLITSESIAYRDSYCTEKSSSQKPEIRESQICRKKETVEGSDSGDFIYICSGLEIQRQAVINLLSYRQ